MLKTFDIVLGAQSPAHPKVFVIGAFDSRITFYSQQVRALSIVHAIRDQGILHDGLRIAVVGGGAAGVTAAAAAALLSNVIVDLYERGDEVLPLQRTSQRRQLDPHIYSWPEIGSDDPVAELPILDWSAGPAREVRQDVKQEFEAIVAAVAPRLRVHLRHEVTAARDAGGALQLDFRRDPRPGEGGLDAADGKVPGQATFDLLLLAFGFGLEALQSVVGAPNASYWNDASVPAEEFEGRAAPRFLISGNGDGGLIDLVAAASAHFDHAGMIRDIVGQPNIHQIFERLKAIDSRALTAFGAGDGFDFPAAYDAEILDDLRALGLFDIVTNRLRPGVRLTLQTRKPHLFTIETATLNRVAAYLAIRACEAGAQTSFTHIQGDDLAVVAAPAGAPNDNSLWFTCAGTTFSVDAAIIRHGPGRTRARQPFAAVLGDFENAHDRWLALHGDAIVVPTLSAAAREAYVNAARVRRLVPPLHLQRRMEAQQPTLVRVQPYAGGLRWSGDLGPAEVGRLWDRNANALDVLVPGAPGPLGPTAGALLRIALHASRATIVGNAAEWRPFVDPLTTGSAHAEHLAPPAIQAGAPAGAARNPVEVPTATQLAGTLHHALNSWVLEAAHRNIADFTLTGRDPGHVIGFRASADLRATMAQSWTVWRPALLADPGLLDRFLRLMICAEDADDVSQDEARVLVGPRKLDPIIRAIAAALAVASAWPETLPRGDRPGNLSRMPAGGTPKYGHACAAELIAREPTAIGAGTFNWQTHFVVLSQMNTPLALATRAEIGMADVDQVQPSIGDRAGAGGILLTLDITFRTAAEAGLAALTALLNAIEAKHFAQLRAAIVE